MNTEKVFMSIVSLIFVIGWSILFWSIRNMRNDIKELFNLTNDQRLKIQSNKDNIKQNEDKLWSEDKLTKVIESAVRKELLEFENRLMKEGKIPINIKK